MTTENGHGDHCAGNSAGGVCAFFSCAGLALRLSRRDARKSLSLLIPEIAEMAGVEQNLYHRYDVWTHSLKALEIIEGLMAGGFMSFGDCAPLISRSLEGGTPGGSCPRKVLLKMAALLHDLGKPRSAKEREGRISFIGHESLGAEMIGDIAARLHLMPGERAYLELLVKNHLRPILLPEQARVTGRAVSRLIKAAGGFLPDLALLSWADIGATAGVLMTGERVLRQHDFVMRLLGEFYFGRRRSLDEGIEE